MKVGNVLERVYEPRRLHLAWKGISRFSDIAGKDSGQHQCPHQVQRQDP